MSRWRRGADRPSTCRQTLMPEPVAGSGKSPLAAVLTTAADRCLGDRHPSAPRGCPGEPVGGVVEPELSGHPAPGGQSVSGVFGPLPHRRFVEKIPVAEEVESGEGLGQPRFAGQGQGVVCHWWRKCGSEGADWFSGWPSVVSWSRVMCRGVAWLAPLVRWGQYSRAEVRQS